MRRQELHPRTAIINKKQKNISKKIKLKALEWLALTFPLAFDNSTMIRPLKLGIMTDILAHADLAAQAGISKSKLREAVVIFTRRIDYLTCLKARETRIDLKGQPAGPVTEEEATHAAAKITRRIEKATQITRKTPSTISTKKESNTSTLLNTDTFPHYPTRASLSNESGPSTKTTRVTSIPIKHKVSRAYDPKAVARLKEKLGLSQKNSTNKETSN